MAQPVIDTLRLSNALQEAGVERPQAEGAARALGVEFGEHVVARGDLDVGFERIRGELGEVRGDMDTRFERVWSEFREVRSDMDTRFERVWSEFREVRSDMDTRFERVWSEFGKVRSDMDTRFERVWSEFRDVRAEMTVMKSDLDAKIDTLGIRMETGFNALDSKLRYLMVGMGLMLTFLSAIGGIAVFQQFPSGSDSTPQAAWTEPPTLGQATTITTPKRTDRGSTDP